MISIQQLEANRRNAQKSTGPQTPEGRAAVRNNALTHGLTAKNAVLPGESKEEFHDFFTALAAEYQPVGPTETLLLDQIVMDAWRLQRLRGMETGWFDLGNLDIRKRFAEQYTNANRNHLYAYIFRQDANGPDVLSRLGRHESRIQRSFYRALQELQRLQSLRTRSTQSVPAPEPPPVSAPAPANPAPDPTPPPENNLTNQSHFRKTDVPSPLPAVSPSPVDPPGPILGPSVSRRRRIANLAPGDTSSQMPQLPPLPDCRNPPP